MGSFIVLAAPEGTPPEALEKIEAAFQTAYESDEFQSWLAQVGVTPAWLPMAEVTDWADETTSSISAQLDKLVEDGIISK